VVFYNEINILLLRSHRFTLIITDIFSFTIKSALKSPITLPRKKTERVAEGRAFFAHPLQQIVERSRYAAEKIPK